MTAERHKALEDRLWKAEEDLRAMNSRRTIGRRKPKRL